MMLNRLAIVNRSGPGTGYLPTVSNMTTILRPPVSVTIGTPGQFAIRVDLDDNLCGELLVGKIGCINWGRPVGDFALGTSLRDVTVRMRWIHSDAYKRHTNCFMGMGKALFVYFRVEFFGDHLTCLEEVALRQCEQNITLHFQLTYLMV